MKMKMKQTKCGILSAICAYYSQDQFIPLHHLKLDDKLKDAEGVFGEVRHGKYFGMDIAVKRAKPETKKQRKLIYTAFLHEAKILGFVFFIFYFEKSQKELTEGRNDK